MTARAQIVAAVLGVLTLAAVAGLVPAPDEPVADLELAVSERFAFTPEALSCPAGARIRLRLVHRTPASGPDIPHTAAILLAGTDVEAFARAAVNARSEDRYVPIAFRDRVVAATPLVHAAASLELEFRAPSAPGDYPVVCTFPGHCLLGMRATLVVR